MTDCIWKRNLYLRIIMFVIFQQNALCDWKCNSVWFVQSAYHIPTSNRQYHSAFHTTYTAWLISLTAPRSFHLPLRDFPWIIIKIHGYVTEGFFPLILVLCKRLLVCLFRLWFPPTNFCTHFPLSSYLRTKYQVTKTAAFHTQSTV
jgi:hypothetical protein